MCGGAILEDGDGIDAVRRFDPKLCEWAEMAPMLIPRSGSAATVLGGAIYVMGGWHASTENTNKVLPLSHSVCTDVVHTGTVPYTQDKHSFCTCLLLNTSEGGALRPHSERVAPGVSDA